MRILGLIVEYNPFHSGHLYHLEEAQRVCQPDLTIAIMSGHFTQRGDIAIVDKWSRAEMAVRAGVDAVFELPTAWALRSARDFAHGAVWHLDLFGATHLCFGSEAGDLTQLAEIAELLVDEPQEYRDSLKGHLSKGLPYPRARLLATAAAGASNSDELLHPNNILGVAYLCALKRLNSSIEPVTIKRKGAGYHDPDLQQPLASATAIRKGVLSGKRAEDLPVPSATKAILAREFAAGRGPLTLASFETLIRYAVRNTSVESLSLLPDMEPGLGYRLKKAEEETSNMADFLDALKTKRYTFTRMQRILCYALLGLSASRLAHIHTNGPKYLRLLALKKGASHLLKKSPLGLPILTRVAEHRGMPALELDIAATNIYTLAFPSYGQRKTQQDFTTPPVLVE